MDVTEGEWERERKRFFLPYKKLQQQQLDVREQTKKVDLQILQAKV